MHPLHPEQIVTALALGLSLFVVGCGPAASSPAAPPPEAPVDTAADEPTATLPAAPTETPEPTSTPSPTPGPGLPELILTPRADYANAQLDAARTGYESLADLYPANAEPWIGLAEIAAREGDPDSELDALRAGAQAQPKNLEALRALAVVLDARGLDAELAEVYAQIAALTPEDPAPLLASALLFAGQGEATAAIEVLGRYAAQQPGRAEAGWINAAAAAYAARFYEAAAEIATAGLQIESDSSSLHFIRAMSALALEDQESARADLDQALALKPNFVEAALWRGRLRAEAADSEGARADFAQAIAVGRASGLRDEELAFQAMAEETALLAATDAAGAFDLMARYVIQHGSRDALLLGYARIEWARGSRDRAIERLAGLVNAEYAPALYWRGVFQIEQGQAAEGRADLEAFLALEPYGPWAERARRLLDG